MFAIVVVLVLAFLGETCGHGRLIDPACRSSAWRFNNKTTPVNRMDNELFCGGYKNQWETQKGKCGICGDPWQGPRNNELPNGIFTTNPPQIQRTYNSGSIITKVNLTASHLGYFTFRVCPATSTTVEVDQECLDKIFENKVYVTQVKLPKGLKCERCVFQWDYTIGNRWAKGLQATFRGCADIKIQ